MTNEKKILDSLIKLAVCPGTYSSADSYCNKCEFRNTDCCHAELKNSCREIILKEYEGIKKDENKFESDDLEAEITRVIHQIGIPANFKGYSYIRRAISLAVEDMSIMKAVIKELYPTIAKEFNDTPSRVERAIRHAIEVAWDRGDVDVLDSYFGYTIQSSRGKPTNSEFIAMIADNIKLRFK